MAFDPDKYLKKKSKGEKSFNPDEYISSRTPQEPKEMSTVDKIIEPIVYAGEAMDRFTGAPVRAGIGALQDDDPSTGFWQSAYDQFGEPTNLAPTGKQIAQEAGVSDDVIYEDAPIVGDITKSGAAGLAIDVLADPTVVGALGAKGASKAIKAVSPVEDALRSRAGGQALKSIAQFSTDSKVEKALARPRHEVIGTTLLDEGLGKYLNKPVKMIEILKSKGGPISKNTDDTTGLINRIDYKEIEPMNMASFIEDIKNTDLQKRLDPTKASKLSQADAEKYSKILEQYAKPTTSPYRDLKSMQALKRDIGKKLSSDAFFNPSDKSIAFEKEVMVDLYRGLNDKISELVDGVVVDGVDVGAKIAQNNEKVSAMMDTLSLLDKIPAKDLRGLSGSQELVDLMVSGLTGVAVGGATGSTGLGLAAAGAYGGSKLGQKIAKKLPSVEANVINNIVEGNIMPDKAIMGAQVPRVMSMEGENSRQPNSLVEELVRLKVPRTTDGIMENKDAILMKIAQQRPEMLQAVQDTMEYEPDQISELIPVISQAMPQIFETDKYGRFDNVIIDPAKKQLAKEDTLKDEDLSNSEKMLILDQLNKTGEFYQ